MVSVVDTEAAYAIRENDSSVHAQMTADFFRATLMASSNDVQEKIDHGKKEQVEKTQGEASNGKGQANFGQSQHGETQARQESRQESRQEDAAEGEEKGSGEGKEGREESGA
jgi:hypothetical protein